MWRETIAELKKHLEFQTKRAEWFQKEYNELNKECVDLESRLDYADKVNLANIGMINFLKWKIEVYEKITDTQDDDYCDCCDCDCDCDCEDDKDCNTCEKNS